MNFTFILKGVAFAWDENMNVLNIQKHGNSFQKACEVFFDPGLVTEAAHDDSDGQIRAAIGYLEGEPSLLYVVHMEASNGLIRLISARPVTRKERRTFED